MAESDNSELSEDEEFDFDFDFDEDEELLELQEELHELEERREELELREGELQDDELLELQELREREEELELRREEREEELELEEEEELLLREEEREEREAERERRKERRDAYKRAMEKGEMNVAYGRIMLLGTAGVGKTSLKRSLMKLHWESDTTSTIIFEVSCVRPFGHKWFNISLEDDDKLIEVTDDDEIDEMAKLLAFVDRDPSNTTSVLSSVVASIPKINPWSVSSQIKDIEDTKVDKILSKAISKSELMSPDDLKNIKPQPFLHIWDCGGQPVFLEILPAFLTPRTMFLLMFDASKDFRERWQAVWHKAGRRIFEEEVNVSTLDLMLNWMASIHGHLMRYNSDGGCCEYPRMYCIGTHGDILKTEDKRKEVVEKLESHYKDKEYFQLIDKTLIIDNTSSGRGKNEDPNLGKIRRAICQFTHEKLIVKTPVSWVLFRKVIQLFDTNVIDLDKACEIGVACKIPHDDVPKALLFYHDLGVVLFYPHIKGLKEKVIIKPKWFVETLGKVFTLDEGAGDGETRQMWTLLREKGILVQPFYMSIWRECETFDFSPEAIIELLVSFRLAVEVTTNEYFGRPVKQYFLPLMLKSFKGDPSEVPPGYHLRATPLHITFNTKFVPPGFFTRFVTSFARQPSCELMFNDGIYRNRVTFTYGQPPVDHIFLTDLHSVMQINVLRYAQDNPAFRSIDAVCQELLAVLKDCGDQVDQVLTLSSDFLSESFQSVPMRRKFKYVCKQCPQTNDLHYLVIGDDQLSSVPICCEINRFKFHKPSAEEAVWFKGEIIQEQSMSSTATGQGHEISTQDNIAEGVVYVSTLPDHLLDQQPPILEIITHARTAEWNRLGVKLGLNDVDLAGCHDCTRTYQLWIQEKAENATRRNLITALKAIRQNDVARKYEDHLKTMVKGDESVPQSATKCRIQ